MKRRFFLFAAPAIVAAPSLMRVSTLVLPRRETLHELMARKIRAAEAAMRADLDRAFADIYSDGNSDPNFGLAALLRDDAPIIGGIDRTSFTWWDAKGEIYLTNA